MVRGIRGKKMKNTLYLVLFAIATDAGILLYRNNILTNIVIGIVSLTGLLVWKSKTTRLSFFFAGIVGIISELITVSHGAWTYANPNFFVIPTWLFLIWGNAGIFIVESANEMKRRIK